MDPSNGVIQNSLCFAAGNKAPGCPINPKDNVTWGKCMNAVYLTCPHRYTYYLQNTMREPRDTWKMEATGLVSSSVNEETKCPPQQVLVEILQTWADRVHIRAWSASQSKHALQAQAAGLGVLAGS